MSAASEPCIPSSCEAADYDEWGHPAAINRFLAEMREAFGVIRECALYTRVYGGNETSYGAFRLSIGMPLSDGEIRALGLANSEPVS